jgi:Ca2+-binding EF-hand superfamily protein
VLTYHEWTNLIRLDDPKKDLTSRKNQTAAISVPANASLLDIMNLLSEHLRTAYADVEEGFRQYDVDGNGMLDYIEFYHALNSMGLTLRPAVSKQMFDIFDEDGSGGISYEEFVSTVKSQKYMNHPVILEDVKNKQQKGRPTVEDQKASKVVGKALTGHFRLQSPVAASNRTFDSEASHHDIKSQLSDEQFRQCIAFMGNLQFLSLKDIFKKLDYRHLNKLHAAEFEHGLKSANLKLPPPGKMDILFHIVDEKNEGISFSKFVHVVGCKTVEEL